MSKILIFGNSGSGKSTLAGELARVENLAHLDLDTLAWLPVVPPERAPLEKSQKTIEEFIAANDNWVIEGCYADLMETVASQADEIIFMNLSVEQCIENARNRPWEPHKYESIEAQNDNLDMLVDWIGQYHERKDVFSWTAHMRLFEAFTGKKTMYVNNERMTREASR